MKKRLWTILRDWGGSLLLVVLLIQVVGWLRAPDLPEEAPTFALEDLDGAVVSLADLRGRTVVLNFWATWCLPCRVEIPQLSGFAQAHPEITVLGVAIDGSRAELKRGAASLGVDYPVLRIDEATRAAYGISTVPTTVVIDPEGRIRSAHTGIITRPQLWWATRS